ncbi:hypothetical protein NWP21_08685 [Anabaenopsis sp. FSS-46]|uniref:hypothetical protein n=1 Tax=Anabaenopsis sp. FSS-46 TaxID=2971766 RepID=UPI0024730F9F|nr:hypothetical protein [Anabaenopsis sp. FSS-46]MDH6098913.1 hypothetical protein [Anabaenopsis sp. FSS-46]
MKTGVTQAIIFYYFQAKLGFRLNAWGFHPIKVSSEWGEFDYYCDSASAAAKADRVALAIGLN